MGSPSSETLTVQRIGKYALLRQLGAGASGTVYLAEDTSLGRNVALKVLHAQLARDEEFLARFRREARVVAALAHPNIVRVHAFDTVDGQFLIDTEFLAGGPLSARCARTVFDGPTTARVAADVFAGLAWCHGQEFLHRDIKPSNILLDESGTAQLADFGLAKAVALHQEVSLGSETSAGIFLGTPRYAPPEAWEGREQTAQSDLYSVGIVLHEMITGRPPYEAQTPMALMREMLVAPIKPLNASAAGLSDEFGALINQLIQWDPDRRPESAEKALDALQACPESQSLSSPDRMANTQKLLIQLPSDDSDRTGRGQERTRFARLSRGAVLAMLIAVVAACVIYFWNSRVAPMVRGEAVAVSPRTFQEPALRSGIPSIEALRTTWRMQDTRVYNGRILAGPQSEKAQWLFAPEGGAHGSQLMSMTGSRLVLVEHDMEAETLSGWWVALEDDANTILRYGEVTGFMIGPRSHEIWTVTLELSCVQDQTLTRETWQLEQTASTSDTALLMNLEQDTKFQLLLYDQLLPRGTSWADTVSSQFPAIAGQRAQVRESVVTFVPSVSDPAPLRDMVAWFRASQYGISGIPNVLKATLVPALHSESLAIVLHVPHDAPQTSVVRVALSAAPILAMERSPSNLVVLSSDGFDTSISPDLNVEQILRNWELNVRQDEEELFATITIPLKTVGPPMRRLTWRLNAQVGIRTEGGTFEPKVLWGCDDLTNTAHGAILDFKPPPAGWN